MLEWICNNSGLLVFGGIGVVLVAYGLWVACTTMYGGKRKRKPDDLIK